MPENPRSVELDHLRALAEAASPGPWHVCEEPPDGTDSGVATADHDPVATLLDEWYEVDPEEPTAVHDAAFIAAANPATMLALLDRLERAETMHAEAFRIGISKQQQIAAVEAALTKVDRSWGGAAMVVRDAVRHALGERCTNEFCEHDHAAMREVRTPAGSRSGGDDRG